MRHILILAGLLAGTFAAPAVAEQGLSIIGVRAAGVMLYLDQCPIAPERKVTLNRFVMQAISAEGAEQIGASTKEFHATLTQQKFSRREFCSIMEMTTSTIE